MFTRYKGISIPENYSGNRFKTPPETSTKTHKPTASYTGTKTSISPAFNQAIIEKQRQFDNRIDEYESQDLVLGQDSYKDNEKASEIDTNFDKIPDNVYDISRKELENSYENDSYQAENNYDDNVGQSKNDYLENDKTSDTNQNTTSQARTDGKGGILEEISSLFSKLTSNIKSDDLLIVAVIILLLNENNDDNALILPLLCLLLYA